MPVGEEVLAPASEAKDGLKDGPAVDSNETERVVDDGHPPQLNNHQAEEGNQPFMNGTNAKPAEEQSDAKNGTAPIKKSDGSASFLRAARAGNLEKVLEFLKTNTDINTCNANGLNALHLASKEGHAHVVSALLERNAQVDSSTKKGNTALHIASLAGQEEIVKILVAHGASVNIQSQNGFTPLYMAAQENHDVVVKFLLSQGANQSLATEDGFTPLAVALQQGHDRVVAVLLENDTRGKVRLPALHIAAKKDDTKAAALLLHTDHNPDVTSKSGFTPLHIAAHYGNDNIAALLLQRGADVNYVAKHQITPLHVASKWGKGNMVSLLLDKGAQIESKTRDGLTPLHCAARSGHETVVDLLLERGAPITAKTKNGLAPLHMSSQGDHVDAARILLYHKAPVDDVTVDFLTALHVAAHCGHVRVAKLLLDRKADPNSRALNGFTPLHIACKKNRIKVVELLLKHGASIEATTESGLTPLHVGAFMGCMNIVIYLIQHGAPVDTPTVRGETPLHLAARASQTDIIRILLRNGAQVDARAREQQTALHIASRLGNSDIVVLLIQHGAQVDANTKDSYTPLHIAAKEGQEEVASVLLDNGSSLTATTKKGFTPLHLAAKYGNIKVARLLLQKDAPVDATGKNGVTPLHVAAHYDHQDVALLLLDKGATPHAAAKNGYTPLHIAARKNQMDIASTLLEYGGTANAESKAGFTPLHLSAQEGHTEMAALLLEHGAKPDIPAKNGLTPLHLCGQEDRVNVAAVILKNGGQVDPLTKAGYTPLHVACHFGQMNMVRFLLEHGSQIDQATQLGYTPLHQAAQQGHSQIVNTLLESKAKPDMETKDGKTALSIAHRLGYISVVETLKIVTETKVTTNTTTTTEEKYKVVVPETMHETFMSESEDEGDDTLLGDHSYRYLTVDEMKSLGDDSMPIDVTRDEKMDTSFHSGSGAPVEITAVAHSKETLLAQQQHQQHQHPNHFPLDNVTVARAPILAGTESLNTTMDTTMDTSFAIEGPHITSEVVNIVETAPEPSDQTPVPAQLSTTATANEESGSQDHLEPGSQQSREDSSPCPSPNQLDVSINGWEQFLVSFMVDARGGAMRGCRHSGVRVIIPPRKAAMPMRVTCRYLKKDKLVHAPPLMEGEALASRILEMGPAAGKFLGPVIIEVPHFASLRGKEREIVILRSDNGETWREHTLEATEEAVQEVLNESFDGEELKQLEDLNTNRITRILTTDFPQYFAIVTRIRQEVHAIGPEGGMVSSSVVPQVQAVFPQGALTKKIKVGLQAQPISPDLVSKLLGNRVAVSPIVTVEPRRRKFHKPITLTIPVPQAANKGMINQYSGEAPTLRLLCSITGGTTRAQWEDVTGSTPLTFVHDCVSFTTTVSARFWLMDCTNIPEATKMATELYREAIHVPFMSKFVVFSKRHQLEEARVRVFCMTDDKEDKTLETQEHFAEVAKSRDVEVLEGKAQYLEFAGNLTPVTKSGDQLAFNFYAFRENRLPFTVRVKDPNADPVGRLAFMRQQKVGRGDPPQTPLCNLNLSLPENIQPEPAPSEPDLLSLEKKYSFLTISKADTIHRADLRLKDISVMLDDEWVGLARELGITESDINIIKSQYPENGQQQAIVMLRLWMQTSGNKATGNTLENALRTTGRIDIIEQCIFNVEVVTDDGEKKEAKKVLDTRIPPHDELIVDSVEQKDYMKESESAEEEEEISQKQRIEDFKNGLRLSDFPPSFDSEDKKDLDDEFIKSEHRSTREEKTFIESSKQHSSISTVAQVTSKGGKLLKEEKLTKEENFESEDKLSKEMKIDEKIQRKGDEISFERKEEANLDTKELLKDERKEKFEEKKVTGDDDRQIIETAMTKKESVEEKLSEESVHEEREIKEKMHIGEMPLKDRSTCSSDTSSKSRPMSSSSGDSVHEVITKETKLSPKGTDAPSREDKDILLHKLGEELGMLDEKLEEKFNERKNQGRESKASSEGDEVEEVAIVAEPRTVAQPVSQVVVVDEIIEPVIIKEVSSKVISEAPMEDLRASKSEQLKVEVHSDSSSEHEIPEQLDVSSLPQVSQVAAVEVRTTETSVASDAQEVEEEEIEEEEVVEEEVVEEEEVEEEEIEELEESSEQEIPRPQEVAAPLQKTSHVESSDGELLKDGGAQEKLIEESDVVDDAHSKRSIPSENIIFNDLRQEVSREDSDNEHSECTQDDVEGLSEDVTEPEILSEQSREVEAVEARPVDSKILVTEPKKKVEKTATFSEEPSTKEDITEVEEMESEEEEVVSEEKVVERQVKQDETSFQMEESDMIVSERREEEILKPEEPNEQIEVKEIGLAAGAGELILTEEQHDELCEKRQDELHEDVLVVRTDDSDFVDLTEECSGLKDQLEDKDEVQLIQDRLKDESSAVLLPSEDVQQPILESQILKDHPDNERLSFEMGDSSSSIVEPSLEVLESTSSIMEPSEMMVEEMHIPTPKSSDSQLKKETDLLDELDGVEKSAAVQEQEVDLQAGVQTGEITQASDSQMNIETPVSLSEVKEPIAAEIIQKDTVASSTLQQTPQAFFPLSQNSNVKSFFFRGLILPPEIESSIGVSLDGTSPATAQADGKNLVFEADIHKDMGNALIEENTKFDSLSVTNSTNLEEVPKPERVLLERVELYATDKRKVEPEEICRLSPSITHDLENKNDLIDSNQDGDIRKKVENVAFSMASTLERITAASEGLEPSLTSSDDGEEQLTLMRDSPHWEDEEIQAEDPDEPRAIKAEIKLLVKTTETGKESIEIRSIREFVDPADKKVIPSVEKPTPDSSSDGHLPGDRVYNLQHERPIMQRTPSPKFVRPDQGLHSYDDDIGNNEFNLMAQVRDIISDVKEGEQSDSPNIDIKEKQPEAKK